MTTFVTFALLATAITVLGALALARRPQPRTVRSLGVTSGVLAIVTLAVASLGTAGWPNIEPPASAVAVILVTLAATLGGSAAVGASIDSAIGVQSEDPAHRLPGSAAIGVAERGAFFLAALLGYPEVAAVIVAVKSLAIYRKADSELSARRVLGTLASFLWTLVFLLVLVLVLLGLDLPFGRP